MPYDPDQPRDSEGKWTIIAGDRVSIKGESVDRATVSEMADKYKITGDAKQELLHAYSTGKIRDDDHLKRAIAHAVHHGVSTTSVKAGIKKHGKDGSHEHKAGGWEKDAARKKAAVKIVSASMSKAKK